MQIRTPNMYRHPVYFASVNNLTVARYAAAMNVDYVGFCFDAEDPHFITVSKAREIMGWLSGVKFIGEFRHKPADEIAAIGMELALEAVLLNSSYPGEDLSLIPFETVTTFPDSSGDYMLKENKILSPAGDIFAIRFATNPEDVTGVMDFSAITEELEKLEV